MLPRALVMVTLLLSACAGEPALRPTASPVPAASAVEAPPAPGTAAAPAPEVYAPRGSAPAFPGAPQPVAPSRVAPPSLEAAEAEAVAWVGGFAPPGASEYRCAEASTAVVARSGGFVLDPGDWASGPAQIYLVPADPAEARRGFNSPLIVRFRSLGSPATTHLYEALGALDSAAEPPSWVVPVALQPAEGEWLVVANAGRNWGCFVLPPGMAGAASPSRTAAEAEQRGGPRSGHPPLMQSRFEEYLAAPSEPSPTWTVDRTCVNATGRARSGEMVVSYSFGVDGWSPHLEQSKFGFTPLHQPGDLRRIEEPLRLKLTYVEDSRQTYDYLVVGNVYGLDEQNRPTGAAFVASLVPPRAGRWLIVASSGVNWGCFVLDVR